MKKKKLFKILLLIGIFLICSIISMCTILKLTHDPTEHVHQFINGLCSCGQREHILSEYDYIEAFTFEDNKLIDGKYGSIYGIYDTIEIPKSYQKNGQTIEVTELENFNTSDDNYARTIIIPETIVSLGQDFNKNITGVREFVVSPDNQHYKSIDGVIYSKDGKELIAYPCEKSTDQFIIPNEVEIISEYAFCNNILSDIVYHDNIKEVGKHCYPLRIANHTEFGNVRYYGSATNPYLIAISRIDSNNKEIIIHKDTKFINFSVNDVIFTIEDTNVNFKEINGVIYSADETKIIHFPTTKQFDYFEINENITYIDNSFKSAKIDTLTYNNNDVVCIPYDVNNLILGPEFDRFEELSSEYDYNIKIENEDYVIKNNMICTKDFTVLCKILFEQDLLIKIPVSIKSIKQNAIVVPYNYVEKIYYEGNVEEWLKINFENLKLRSPIYLLNNDDNPTEYKDIYIPETISCLESNKLNTLYFQNIHIPNTVTSVSGIINGTVYFAGTSEEWNQLNKNNQYSFDQYKKIYILENNEYKIAQTTVSNPTITLIDETVDLKNIGYVDVQNVYISKSVLRINKLPVIDKNIMLENLYYDGTLLDWCNIELINNPMKFAKNFYYRNSEGEYELLKNLVIPEGVTEVKTNQFNSSSIESITISGSVLKIHPNAFCCVNAKQINLQEGVGVILNEAFCVGDQLESISIPSTTIFISENFLITESLDIFPKALKEIKVAENNNCYCSVAGNLYTKDMKILIQHCFNEQQKEIVIPEGVEIISINSLAHDGYQKISLPDTLKIIDTLAFGSICNIKISIPSSVELIRGDHQTKEGFIIGENTQLRKLDNVSHLVITNSDNILLSKIRTDILTILKGNSINFTGSFNVINLPNTIKYINASINAAEMFYDGTIEDWLKISIKKKTGFMYFNLKDETHKYYLVEEVIIPQSITRIGDYAFCGSIGINEVFLHDNVESIGLQAFLGCRINEVFIPKSVVEIKDSFVSSSQSITLRCEVSQMPEGWIIQRNNIVLYNQTRK